MKYIPLQIRTIHLLTKEKQSNQNGSREKHFKHIITTHIVSHMYGTNHLHLSTFILC